MNNRPSCCTSGPWKKENPLWEMFLNSYACIRAPNSRSIWSRSFVACVLSATMSNSFRFMGFSVLGPPKLCFCKSEIATLSCWGRLSLSLSLSTCVFVRISCWRQDYLTVVWARVLFFGNVTLRMSAYGLLLRTAISLALSCQTTRKKIQTRLFNKWPGRAFFEPEKESPGHLIKRPEKSARNQATPSALTNEVSQLAT